ncbi:hypothetical protein B0H17DRAFT_1124054 [Mycena rosella]|uniref:Uncharacterized protein n=1 Tax=Mycena rosella TaxID=1033263 RepID=A0AAD7MD03_MYCRO|nr:hypothetical protein B0H17DRAFT_1124054 [Mycena rosella]
MVPEGMHFERKVVPGRQLRILHAYAQTPWAHVKNVRADRQLSGRKWKAPFRASLEAALSALCPVLKKKKNKGMKHAYRSQGAVPSRTRRSLSRKGKIAFNAGRAGDNSLGTRWEGEKTREERPVGPRNKRPQDSVEKPTTPSGGVRGETSSPYISPSTTEYSEFQASAGWYNASGDRIDGRLLGSRQQLVS